jgi:hypothetical protein
MYIVTTFIGPSDQFLVFGLFGLRHFFLLTTSVFRPARFSASILVSSRLVSSRLCLSTLNSRSTDCSLPPTTVNIVVALLHHSVSTSVHFIASFHHNSSSVY